MSVPKSQRNESKLTCIVKAEELAVYTMKIVCNEKTFPKRYRWCVTNEIVSETRSILRKLVLANSVRVEDEISHKARKQLQNEALAHCFALLTEINLSYKIFHLASDRVEFWTGLVVNIQRLIRTWQASDDKRFAKNTH